MKQEDVGKIIIRPDFNFLRKHFYKSAPEAEFKKFVKQYKKNGCVLFLPFLTYEQGETFAANLVKILNNYPLGEHQLNLAWRIR